jgi:hypothetical protein
MGYVIPSKLCALFQSTGWPVRRTSSRTLIGGYAGAYQSSQSLGSNNSGGFILLPCLARVYHTCSFDYLGPFWYSSNHYVDDPFPANWPKERPGFSYCRA